jgi:hypothetical protein
VAEPPPLPWGWFGNPLGQTLKRQFEGVFWGPRGWPPPHALRVSFEGLAQGTVELPPWALGVVRPPQVAGLGVAKPSPLWPKGVAEALKKQI